jgi:8-oxo-dGTP diphosphatase
MPITVTLPPETDNIIDKVAWLLLLNKRLLSTRSRGKLVYYIPGGKRESGESDLETLHREIVEELGVQIVIGSERLIGVFEAQAHGKRAGVKVRMTCYTAEYSGELRPCAEVEEIVWLRHSDKEKCSPVDQIIMDWLHKQELLD